MEIITKNGIKISLKVYVDYYTVSFILFGRGEIYKFKSKIKAYRKMIFLRNLFNNNNNNNN